jgi:hypothetical protein
MSRWLSCDVGCAALAAQLLLSARWLLLAWVIHGIVPLPLTFLLALLPALTVAATTLALARPSGCAFAVCATLDVVLSTALSAAALVVVGQALREPEGLGTNVYWLWLVHLLALCAGSAAPSAALYIVSAHRQGCCGTPAKRTRCGRLWCRRCCCCAECCWKFTSAARPPDALVAHLQSFSDKPAGDAADGSGAAGHLSPASSCDARLTDEILGVGISRAGTPADEQLFSAFSERPGARGHGGVGRCDPRPFLKRASPPQKVTLVLTALYAVVVLVHVVFGVLGLHTALAVRPKLISAADFATHCDPLLGGDFAPCALPFPSSYHLHPDPESATGVRVGLPSAALVRESPAAASVRPALYI